MCKRKSSFETFEEISERMCWLHLIAVGELNVDDSTLSDAASYYRSIGEDCCNCQYVEDCLCDKFMKIYLYESKE